MNRRSNMRGPRRTASASYRARVDLAERLALYDGELAGYVSLMVDAIVLETKGLARRRASPSGAQQQVTSRHARGQAVAFDHQQTSPWSESSPRVASPRALVRAEQRA